MFTNTGSVKGATFPPTHRSESEFVNFFKKPAGIDSQSGGPVRQPYMTYWPARLHIGWWNWLRRSHGWRNQGIIHRGRRGAYLRCPVSTAVQFSLPDEGSTEYICVRRKITRDNIYRCQSVCPVVLNDFDLRKYNISDSVMGAKLNFNTHLLKIMFDFLSHLSAGPNFFYCTETLALYIQLSLYG